MLLKDDYPSLKVVMLEQNYRSTSRILKCANTLIANNPHAFEKQLWSEMGVGDEIRVIRCRNEDAEAERVAVEILSLHLRTDRPYSDFAILYRGNYQAKLIELKLQHHQVPYRLSGGNSFFGRQEVKDLMAYFRLIVNPDDDNAFLRVINVPRREIGSTTLEKLGNYATGRKISMYNASDEVGLGEHLDSRYSERLQRFKRWMDGVRQQCAQRVCVAPVGESRRQPERGTVTRGVGAADAAGIVEGILQASVITIQHFHISQSPVRKGDWLSTLQVGIARQYGTLMHPSRRHQSLLQLMD